MTSDSILLKSSDLEIHKKLVTLISEECKIFEIETDKAEKERHQLILDFLIELQCISSRRLYENS